MDVKPQKTTRPVKKSGLFGNFFAHVALSERILFTKHMAMMIKAGMPIVTSLKLIRRQITGKTFGRILDGVIIDLENGQFMSVSFDKFRNVFGELFINIIKIGETSGTLAENLEYISSELKKKQALQQKVVAALIYPVIILIATVGLSAGMLFFIFPKILPIFQSLKVELPLSTRILVAISNGLFQNWYWAILALFILIIALVLLLRIKSVKFFYHRLVLSLPVVGKMTKNYNIANITRTLGLLLKSGITLVEGILIITKTTSNLVYKKELLAAAEWVKKGETLNTYLTKKENIFLPTMVRMIEVGETTGQLENNLVYLSDFFESELDELTKNLSGILEPVLLLFMGLIVAFIAISIVTPIYQVTQTLQPK